MVFSSCLRYPPTCKALVVLSAFSGLLSCNNNFLGFGFLQLVVYWLCYPLISSPPCLLEFQSLSESFSRFLPFFGGASSFLTFPDRPGSSFLLGKPSPFLPFLRRGSGPGIIQATLLRLLTFFSEICLNVLLLKQRRVRIII